MDISTAIKLNELTNAFYKQNANSFSQTRTRSWPGWQRIIEKVYTDARGVNINNASPCSSNNASAKTDDTTNATANTSGALKILDLACGNMRFLQFLQETLAAPNALEYHAVDNCAQLASLPIAANAENHTHFQQLDLIAALNQNTLAENISAPECDLTVCFGFMHHIPIPDWRANLIQALALHTRSGGYIAIAFWQFLKSERMRTKANRSTEIACKKTGITFNSPNDKLLGWQDTSDTFRYCHNFTEEEIDELISHFPGLREVDRFSADGKENLNRYVILKKE